MKRLFSLMFVMLAIMMPANLWAQEPYAVLTTDTTSVLSSDSTGVTYGKTLTFYYDDQKATRGGMSVGPFTRDPSRGWSSYVQDITTVVFDDTFTNCTTLTSTAFWFYGCEKLTDISGIGNLKTDNVTDMMDMFFGCSGLTNLDVTNFNTANVTNMNSMFYGCSGLTNLDVSNFNTANVTNMIAMFCGCSSLTTLDVSNFNTNKVTSMLSMFQRCSSLTSLNLSNFNTDKVTSMRLMFRSCSGLTTLNLSNFNTANVTDMRSMFQSCSGLTTLNLSGFNTGNVKDMESMFFGCSGLTNLDVTNFNTANVTNMNSMFYGCSGLTNLDVSNFNTANVTDMSYMFIFCTGLTSLDVSNFKTDNVMNMSYMFCHCSGLTTIYAGSGWSTAAVTSGGEMFTGCTSLVGGTGTPYDANHTDHAYAHIDGGESNPGYFTEKNASVSQVATPTFTRNNNIMSIATTTENATIYYTLDGSTPNRQSTQYTSPFEVTQNCTVKAIAVADDYEDSEVATYLVDWFDQSMEGTVLVSFDSAPSNNMFTVGGSYGDGKITYDGVYYKKGVKMDSKGSITFTPAKNYNMTIIMGTVKGGRDVQINGAITSVGGTENTEGSYYELQPIAIKSGTEYVLTKGSAEGLVMLIKLSPNQLLYCPTPTITRDGNILTMSCSYNSATIYYTIDGSIPNKNSTLYTDSITITQNCTVKAIAVAEGYEDSEVAIYNVDWFSEEGLDTLEIYAVETGSTITPNQPIMATQSVIVTPGNDVEWPTNMSMGSAWANPLDFTSNIYYPGSTMTYTFEGSMRGTNNPKDGDLEDGVSTGSGYKPYQKNYPKSGGFLTFEVQQEGSLIVPIRVFAGKPLYVTDKTGTAKKDIQFKDASGQTLALQTNPLCAVSADEDVTGFVSFNVQPGEKYYVFSVGSKARFGGYVFSKQAIDIDPATMANVIDSLDALPTTLEPYAVLTTDSTTILSQDSTGITYGKTLTFYYDNQKEAKGGMDVGPFLSNDERGWNNQHESITNVVFDDSFANCTTLTSTAYWFEECSQLTSISGIQYLKTDSVTTMRNMFGRCSSLTSLDVSGFNTAKVTSMQGMFYGCSSLISLDVSGFKTDNVTDMRSMFSGCSELTTLDVSHFNTENLTSTFMMFSGCSKLTTLDVSGFNTAKVTMTDAMFNGCSGLTTLDLSGFNTENVRDMGSMFRDCSGLKTIYAGSAWTTNALADGGGGDMFLNCTSLVGGKGTVYDAEHIDADYAHIDGGTSNPGYLTSIADTAAVAPVTFACENNELTLLCETPNTTIWYAVNQNVTDTLDVKSVTIAEFNAAEVSNDVWYRLTGTVHNLKDGDRYGNFNLQDETDSVYVYGLLSAKDGEKKKFQELVAEKGITNGSTITIIGHRGEYNGKVEVVNAYYDNGEGDWQQYTAPLALDSDCTVKAYAARPSGIRSAISSYVFKKTERPKVETPTFAWENDKLLISSATEDATIYYSVKEFTTEPTGDGTLASPYNVAAALQYINTLEGDSPSTDSIFVKGVVSDIKDVSPQYGNATFYITDIGKTGGNYLYAYRVKDVGNQDISSEDAVKLGDEVIIRGLVVKYRGVTPETVQGAAYIYAYTTPEMNMLYESPIAVSDNVIVRAKATKQDMSDSEMAMLSVSSEPYALLSENNTKLTFYYDKLKDAKGGMGVGPFIQSYNTETGSYYLQGREWEDHAGDITTVEFDPSFGNCTTITNMVGWFFENTKLQTINGLEYLNTSNVTNMLALFNGCTSLTSLDLSTFDTHNVTNMRGMFYGCTSLTTLNVSSFNTSNVLGFNSMFNNCTSLKSIDVSRFDTKNATSLRMMFLNCHSLEALDITNFETSNVTDMYYVFGGLQLPSIDLSKMNTEKVETMEGLFSHTAFTSLDLSSFNTSQVKDMYSMFANSSNLQTIYVGDGWSTESIVITDSTSYGSRLFYGCEKLVGGKGTVYDASHIDVTYAHIDGGTSNPGYFTDKNAPVIDATFDGRVLAVGGSTTMTDALESVGGRDEVAKTITAIVWNSSATLSNSDLQGLDNPNLLIYVNERSQAPQNRNNVVVNGLAMNVVLSDTGSGNCDFYAPQTFTAEMITYSREFKQATQVGVCRGWETISLPFMVQTIAHADQGVITPFGIDTSNKHFWLRQLSTNGLVSTTKIEANLPYLISMPNDEKNYAKEYILKGLVTFSAQNAVVPKTEPTMLALADSSVVMLPALQSVGKSSTVWALNVGQERSQYFEGSTFERDYHEVRPFEAYTVHRSDTPAPRFLPINDLMNSATGIETISNVIMSHDNYYRLDGRKVDGKPTKKGLYITNGRKVVIK